LKGEGKYRIGEGYDYLPFGRKMSRPTRNLQGEVGSDSWKVGEMENRSKGEKRVRGAHLLL